MFSYFAAVLTYITRVMLCLSIFPLYGEMGQFDPAWGDTPVFQGARSNETKQNVWESSAQFQIAETLQMKMKRFLPSKKKNSSNGEGAEGDSLEPSVEERKEAEQEILEFSENKSYEQEFTLVFSDWVDKSTSQISFELKAEGNHYAMVKGGEPAWWNLESPQTSEKKRRSWRVSSEILKEPESPAPKGKRIFLKIKNTSRTGKIEFKLPDRKMVVLRKNGKETKPSRQDIISLVMGDIYEAVVIVKDDKPVSVWARHEGKDLLVSEALQKLEEEVSEDEMDDMETSVAATEKKAPVLVPEQGEVAMTPESEPLKEETKKEPVLSSEKKVAQIKKTKIPPEPREIVHEVKKVSKKKVKKNPVRKLKKIPVNNRPTPVKVVPEFIPKDLEEYKIITPKAEKEEPYDFKYVLVFAEWEDKSISQVTVNLKKGGNYYAIIKDGMPTWMNLESSKPSPSSSEEKQVRLKLRNVSISRELTIEFPGKKMKVFARNGRKVEARISESIKLQVGETYDVMIALSEEDPFQVRASSGNLERLNPSRPMEDRISLVPKEKKVKPGEPEKTKKKERKKKKKKKPKKLQEPEKPRMPERVIEEAGYKRTESEGLVEYEIPITYKTVNLTGKDVRTFSVGGDIVAPTITARVGDILRVTFHNTLDHDTSVHWHGVLVPNDQDGVPYLTTPPIKAHSSFTYEIPVRHSGTYWYHSHTGLQRQRGIYGPMVFYPEDGESSIDEEHVLVFSDWNDESPSQTLANLKKDGDYYALKKDSVVSWGKILGRGSKAVHNRLRRSWQRMGPMDVSDVGYDAFLVNGRKEVEYPSSKGKKLCLRLVNASASTYFNVEFSGGFMTVVAADGMDVEPFDVQRLRISVAETYDVVVTIPEDKAFEFRATAEDGTGFSSAFLGSGEKVVAATLPKPDLVMGEHGEHDKGHSPEMKDYSEHHHEEKESVISHMTNYDPLKSLKDSSLPEGQPWRELELRLTGNMETYNWSFNDKALSEADTIKIKKGENVRFVLKNDTMMHHPVHLHGHFFRVVNKQGKRSPLKHTVNVEAMGTTVIEFDANEEKDWFFHCHNLYHMASGMSRVVGYEGTSQMNKETLSRISTDSRFFYKGELGIESNMVSGMFQMSNSRNVLGFEFDNAYGTEYEIETRYSRRVSRFLDVYAGGQLLNEKAKEIKDEELFNDQVNVKNSAFLGVHYVLPLLIEADLRIDSDGEFLFGLESGLQLTDRLSFSWHWNTDWEYRLKLAYEINKRLSLSASLDSDFHGGGGLTFKF